MKNIKILFTTLLLLLPIMALAQNSFNDEEYKVRVRNNLRLDYSMPDYTTSKIDAKVLGPRLDKILERILETYDQNVYLSSLSIIQSSQVEGLNYGRIKSLKLGKVEKHGNEISIRFNTNLEKNNLDLKKSQIVFSFVGRVSMDQKTNDYFTNICRYIKE